MIKYYSICAHTIAARHTPMFSKFPVRFHPPAKNGAEQETCAMNFEYSCFF